MKSVLKKRPEFFNDLFSYEVFDEGRYRVTGTVIGFVLGRFVTVSVIYRDELVRMFSDRDAEPIEIEEYNNGIRSILRNESMLNAVHTDILQELIRRRLDEIEKARQNLTEKK